MGTCKIWLAFETSIGGNRFRKVLDGYPCEIQGVTMVVHKVPDPDPEDRNKKPKWRVSDPFTGYRASHFVGPDRKSAINKVKGFVIALEEKDGRPFSQIMDEKRKEFGNVMDLPERGPDGIQESMSA